MFPKCQPVIDRTVLFKVGLVCDPCDHGMACPDQCCQFINLILTPCFELLDQFPLELFFSVSFMIKSAFRVGVGADAEMPDRIGKR
jgi:hypothetical protein